MLIVGVLTSTMVLMIARHRLSTAMSDRVAALREYNEVAQQVSQFNDVVLRRRELVNVIEKEQIALRTVSGTRILSEVTDALPSQARLESLVFCAKDSTIHIKGRANSSANVMRLKRTFLQSELFTNLEAGETENDSSAEKFDVSVQLSNDADWTNNPSIEGTTTVLLDGGDATR